MGRILIFILITSCFVGCNYSSVTNKNSQQSHVIAFYNLENLFDTINDAGIRDGEFTPEGSKAWNTERYISKQNNISKVIADLGSDQGINGPSLVGLCEMENISVLEDLIKTDKLKNNNYSIIHYDSPDSRGIDVALLYNNKVFEVENTHPYPLIITSSETGKRLYTRDQLLVSGKLEGDPIHLIINHWPSRYGGLERSIPSRKAAAILNRQIIDSLLSINKDAKIISMGDFNDDPIDESISIHLDAHAEQDQLEKDDLYNPLAAVFNNGEGSLFYRGKWNLFDQMILSQGLMENNTGYKLDTACVYKKQFLFQQDDRFKGYLLRTYGGKNYLDGYSDHLPVYMVLSQK